MLWHVDFFDNVLGAEFFEVAVEFCKLFVFNWLFVYFNLNNNWLG